MTFKLIIEGHKEKDIFLMKEIANRLGLITSEITQRRLTKDESLALLDKVAGSWEGPETGDELNAMIYGSRFSGNRDVEL
ncbi:hypothetical protein [Dyadobacter sp. CY326]|uniref:hypothetical protein n=1 Tax=Dyadobacter sp. CY326 TaxID=2907300 RepID=UPI001F1ACF30|nr:hypothetical protein [Dyadobacter sp. CY326]MCE7068004.1 hypothetical protein [Dyadobacter sp. CY326]